MFWNPQWSWGSTCRTETLSGLIPVVRSNE